jgi:hypothetical protein
MAYGAIVMIVMSDETWDAICDSLKTHPTLEVLDLSTILNYAAMTPAVMTSWTQALLDMMKMNMSIHTMYLPDQYSEHELFRRSVIPYLEANRFRLHVRAIQKKRPIMYRVKVLGRALVALRTDPNRFWMLLSGNAELAFPSTTATTAPAMSLPTPTNAAATSDTATATVTFSISAVDIIASPTTCQKRKARP